MTKQMLAAMATGLALIAATPAIAQQGGSTGTAATTQGPILSFSVSEEVRPRPDQATVGAGVTTTAPTAVEAMRANAAAMDKLIAAAKARGIKAADIQTSGINLSPQYDYSNRTDGQPPRFLGYQVSNTVRATTGKIDDIDRSEEHTSELQSLMRISYAVFCLKKKKKRKMIKKIGYQQEQNMT